jgi:hypothetical protein
VPFVLERELETNPFLRADDSALAERWGAEMPWRCSLRSERPRIRFKKEVRKRRCEGLPLALPERLPTIR